MYEQEKGGKVKEKAKSRSRRAGDGSIHRITAESLWRRRIDLLKKYMNSPGGRMGHDGAHIHTFTAQLILDLQNAQLEKMTRNDWILFFFLADLSPSIPEQRELFTRITRLWDERQKDGRSLEHPEVVAFMQEYWLHIKTVEGTMSSRNQ